MKAIFRVLFLITILACIISYLISYSDGMIMNGIAMLAMQSEINHIERNK